MEVKFTDSFFESLEKMSNRERWYWKTWDFFRYDLPNGIKNIFFFWRVVWQFRPWDSSFQLRILARSLEPLAHNLEHHSFEVNGPRLKKIAAIRRAIEILHNQADDDYISIAEERLGTSVDTSYGIFGDKPEGEEPDSIKEMNSKIFKLADEINEQELEELFTILKGQNHTHFTMLCDKARAEGNTADDLWDQWFDGSGIKGWWN